MERRTALAAAAVGAMLAASGVVAVSTSLLDSGGQETAVDEPSSTTVATAMPSTTAPGPVVVTETRDVFDTIVVPVTDPVSGTADPAPPARGSGSGKSVQATAPPTTSAPAPTTTVPSTTSTTRPPGVPADWPADKPIPPMPEGCQKPQLEDNGQWNCDH